MGRGVVLGACLGLGIAWPAAAGETIVPLSGEVPDDGLDHFRVPFEVPGGVVEIEVRHDDLSTANILDWGLEDPDGFRGWGGGNEEPAVVGLDAASRSYVPGPIPAGTWNVVVGKAQIDDPPGQYAIEVVLRGSATLSAQPERAPYRPAPALSDQAGWYAGDVHVHSLESGDARPALDEIGTFARARGLDFVVISDHNVHTALDFFAAAQPDHPQLLFVPGVEFTTYDGHANGLGATSFVDHKIGQPGVTIAAAAEAYREQGALFAINHPVLDLGPLCIGCAWGHELDPSLVDAVEIATGGLEPFGAQWSDAAIAFWDDLCAQGYHVAAIGGSDDHKAGVDLNQFQSPIGDATTVVFAQRLDAASILAGIRDGRTVVKLQGVDDPMIEFSAEQPIAGDTITGGEVTLLATVTGAVGQRVRWVANGEVVRMQMVTEDPQVLELVVEAPPSGQDRYRVELLVDGQRRVVTSHLWVEAGPEGTTTTGPAGSDSGAPAVTSTSADAGTTAAEQTGSGQTQDSGGAAGRDAGCGCQGPERRPGGWLVALLLFGGRRRVQPKPSSTPTSMRWSARIGCGTVRR